MDPLSVTVAAVSLVASIRTLLVSVNDFARKVRDAQSDIDLVKNELESVQYALEFLTGYDLIVPQALNVQFSGIITQTRGIVDKIKSSIDEQSAARVSRRIRWVVSGREDIENLRSSLEQHKSALNLAVDCLALCNTAAIQSTTVAIREQDVPRILREITRLRITVEQSPNFLLQRYMADVSEYAESLVGEGSVAGDNTRLGATTGIDDEVVVINNDLEDRQHSLWPQTQSGSDSLSDHSDTVSSGASTIPGGHKDLASLETTIVPNLDPVDVPDSEPGVILNPQPERMGSVSTTTGSSDMQEQPLVIVSNIISCDRTFSPDKSLIQNAEIKRRFLNKDQRLALDQNLWRIAYEPDSQRRSVELKACLAAGADPNTDKEVDCLGLLNARGLVWRLVHIEDNASLKIALLYGAHPSLPASTLEKVSTSPLYYAATQLNHEAVELLLHSGADSRKHGPLFEIAFTANPDSEAPVLEKQARSLELLDVIVTRHRIFEHPLSGKVLSTAVNSAAIPNAFYGVDVVNFLLREGAFYPDILRDVFQHFQVEDVSLDLVKCILDKSDLLNNLNVVTANLPCNQLETRNVTPMSMDDLNVLQLLLQRGSTFADYDNLIYSVLFAIYSCSIEFPDGQLHSKWRTKPRTLLVLDVLKLIARQGGRFDIFKKRKWENMAGVDWKTKAPRSGSDRDFLYFINWRHTSHLQYSEYSGVRRREIEEQVLEMAFEKPSKIERGLTKSGRFAIKYLLKAPLPLGLWQGDLLGPPVALESLYR